jgi:hypothetical protein
MVLFEGYTYLWNSSEKAYWEQTQPITTLETMVCRKYSFQRVSEFSQGNNLLEAAASNMDGFLWRDTFVSSSQLNRAICRNMSTNPP